MRNYRTLAAWLCALTLCLLAGSTARAADGAGDGAFTKGTTVGIGLAQNNVNREYLPTPNMYGVITVSVAGKQVSNQVVLYGRRDGPLNPLEEYWQFSPYPRSLSFKAGQKVMEYSFPFGPAYPIPTPETVYYWQCYKYTAILLAGNTYAYGSAYLTVQNFRYGTDVITPIVDETM
ncbi:MAG TPA: hypothetical protein VGL77_20865 [Armatimonadota bacterium]|jgi:hypothetical protein